MLELSRTMQAKSNVKMLNFINHQLTATVPELSVLLRDKQLRYQSSVGQSGSVQELCFAC